MEKVENDRMRFRKEFENDSWIMDMEDHGLDEPLFKDSDQNHDIETDKAIYESLL